MLALAWLGGTGAAADRAAALNRWAREALLDSTLEARQRAVRHLEEAIELEPANPEHWFVLGRAHALAGFAEKSRECFRRATAIAPRDPAGWFESGMAWRREWIRVLDPAARDRAIAAFDTATRLRPNMSDAWLRKAPMLYERGDREAALAAAGRAVRGRWHRDQARLALGYLSFRAGDLARADSLFALALPGLDPSVRPLFEKPAMGLGLAAGPAATEVFWEGRDPDPTTRENEFQLEYWSRVAHAYLLFYDPLAPELDERVFTYLRYGPPARVELNPLGVTNTFSAMPGGAPGPYGGSLAMYPYSVQAWEYPALGMRVILADRSLTGRFVAPPMRDDDPTRRPDPRVLAKRGDLLALGGGVAIFPKLPPPEQQLEVEGVIARFRSGGRPRLFAQARARGGPGEKVTARWVVLDARGREAVRDTQVCELSSCGPESLRVARFTADLPPGDYRVVLSVTDRHRRRGLAESPVRLAAPPAGLALSDIVPVCPDPAAQLDGRTVRIEAADENGLPPNRALSVYFEIYGLAPAAEGLARFEYTYQVRRRAKAEAVGAPVREYASGEIPVRGTLRRQFVSIPAQSLPAGDYALTVNVRDLAGGRAVERTIPFSKR